MYVSYTHDSDAFMRATGAAKFAQTRALKIYKQQLQERLQKGSNNRVWWQTIKSISGICASSTRFAPDVEDLGKYFASKFTLREGFEESQLVSDKFVRNHGELNCQRFAMCFVTLMSPKQWDLMVLVLVF